MTLTILTVVSLFLLFLPTETKLTFTNKTSNIFLYPVIFLTGRLVELKLLNRDLSEINDKLNKALLELNELRATKDIATVQNQKLIVGLVIARDEKTRARFLTIDRGKADGVRSGLPVLFEGHLIGKVIEANHSQSIIETILNPGFRISILHKPSGSNGILETAAERITIKYLPRNIKIEPGDTIITSDLSSFAPPGLLVGEVDFVKAGDGLFFLELTLLPFKNISGLNNIYIMIGD